MASEFEKLIQAMQATKRARERAMQEDLVSQQEFARLRPERNRKAKEKVKRLGEELELKKIMEIARSTLWHGKGQIEETVDIVDGEYKHYSQYFGKARYRVRLNYPTSIKQEWEESEYTPGANEETSGTYMVLGRGVNVIPINHRLELEILDDDLGPRLRFTYPVNLPEMTYPYHSYESGEKICEQRQAIDIATGYPNFSAELTKLQEALITQAKRTDPGSL